MNKKSVIVADYLLNKQKREQLIREMGGGKHTPEQTRLLKELVSQQLIITQKLIDYKNGL